MAKCSGLRFFYVHATVQPNKFIF